MQSAGNAFGKSSHGVTSFLRDRKLGNAAIVQQKQTSLQLIQFLQRTCRSDLPTSFEEQIRPIADRSSHDPTSALLMEGTPPDVKGKPVSDSMEQGKGGLLLASPALAFTAKEDSIDDRFSYSYVVSTKSELWDVGDLFINEGLVLSTSTSQQVNVLDLPKGACTETNHKIMAVSQPRHSACVQRILTSGGRDLDIKVQGDSLAESEVGKKVPAFQIRKYEEMAITVTHVINPSNFFIQLVGPELQQLSLTIDLDRRSSFAEVNHIPDIGEYVVGWFPRQKLWCRAQVINIYGMLEEDSNLREPSGVQNIEVEVRRIDYGDITCIPLQNVKELDDSTAALPEQARQVALANVSPVNGQDWSPEAICWFKDKVHNKTLFARLFPQEEKVFVDLFMEKGKIGGMRRSASLSVKLAQNGYASYRISTDLQRIKFLKTL